MRDSLGVLLVEGVDGKVAVQLFERPEAMAETIAGLRGKMGDPPSRATWLSVGWPGPGEVSVDATATDLPVIPAPDSTPWGWRVGEGPMDDPEGGEDDSGD